MKRLLIASLLAVVSTSAVAADVGVSVSIGQPGFYGQIDINNYPQPQLIYRQPVMVHRVPVSRQPVYLHVPPGHAKNWRKHCREYNACGERVYFVRDSWYNQEYVPRYQEKHRDHRDDRHSESGGDRGGKQGGKERGNDHERGR
ncbi:MAG: hypothetical protein Q8J80_11585 [Gallionella sp.]|nr:hypothetical protein [Gallionella sp.]